MLVCSVKSSIFLYLLSSSFIHCTSISSILLSSYNSYFFLPLSVLRSSFLCSYVSRVPCSLYCLFPSFCPCSLVFPHHLFLSARLLGVFSILSSYLYTASDVYETGSLFPLFPFFPPFSMSAPCPLVSIKFSPPYSSSSSRIATMGGPACTEWWCSITAGTRGLYRARSCTKWLDRSVGEPAPPMCLSCLCGTLRRHRR